MFGRFTKNTSPEVLIESFRKEINRQEDIIYGVALFFECISLIHANQDSVIETYRKQFRNIIQKGKETTAHASELLEHAVHDRKKTHLLQQFKFNTCEGHPTPEIMADRATALTETYCKIFPDRPREQDFTPDEILELIENASEADFKKI